MCDTVAEDLGGHAGTRVKAGEPLVVLSAMKMETAVGAPCSGVVQHVAVSVKDMIEAGTLLNQYLTTLSRSRQQVTGVFFL